MNPKAAANYLNIEIAKLYKLLSSFEITAKKHGGRWEIDEKNLQDYTNKINQKPIKIFGGLRRLRRIKRNDVNHPDS